MCVALEGAKFKFLFFNIILELESRFVKTPSQDFHLCSDNMIKGLAIVVIVLLLNKGRAGNVEPRCSKYDFEEKVLEKVVRFEHKMELFTDSIEKIAAKVEDTLDSIQKEQEKLKSETNAEWVDIKTQFGLLKRHVEEQSSTMNGTIYRQLSSFKNSFDDITGNMYINFV